MFSVWTVIIFSHIWVSGILFRGVFEHLMVDFWLCFSSTHLVSWHIGYVIFFIENQETDAPPPRMHLILWAGRFLHSLQFPRMTSWWSQIPSHDGRSAVSAPLHVLQTLCKSPPVLLVSWPWAVARGNRRLRPLAGLWPLSCVLSEDVSVAVILAIVFIFVAARRPHAAVPWMNRLVNHCSTSPVTSALFINILHTLAFSKANYPPFQIKCAAGADQNLFIQQCLSVD